MGVVVRDLDKTIEYWQSLGIVTKIDPESIGIGDNRNRNVYIGPLTVALTQPSKTQNWKKDDLDRNGEGLNHIAFTVDDIDSEKAKMVEKGVPVIFAKEGNVYFDTRKVGNVVIQFLQRRRK